jgi:L-amino acid N-acyltransferase YncA
MVRQVRSEDAEQLTAIYNYYIETSGVTFEEDKIASSEMRFRIEKINVKNNFPFLVYEEEGQIKGYAYATTFRERVAYRFSVESTVYVAKEHFSKGIGRILYAALLGELKKGDCHSVIGVITLPNEPSVKLHESFGFKKVGHFTEVGYKFEQWMDVGFWELLL